MLKILLGNGLLTSEGDFWRKQRRLIQPAFHRKKLEDLTSMMIERSQEFADKFGAYAQSGEYVDILPELTALTLDIISKAIFSSGVDEDKGFIVAEQITLLNEYTIEKLNRLIPVPAMIPTPFNVKERKAIQLLNDIINDIINQRRKEGVSKSDLLSMLIDARDEETGEAMDNQQLRDEVMTIFLAGNETTANALTWALYLLSQNPEAEQKMIAEIESKKDVVLNFNTVNEFHYVRQVIDESMRLYPPAYSVGRRTIEDDELGGYRIPKGTNVLVPIILYHRSPQFWKDPLKFDPDRFSPERKGEIDRFAYFPFGAGPRLCIGNNFALLEMEIVLITLYSKFKFRLKPGFVAEAEPLVTLKPRHGMMMKVERV
jgi:cytochrome P450